MNFISYKYKKIIYFLCAFAFMIIEFIRNNTNGDGWAVGNNYTGLVVFAVILLNCNLKDGCLKMYIAETGIAAAAIIFFGIYEVINPEILFTAKVISVVVNVWWIAVILSHYLYLFWIKKASDISALTVIKNRLRDSMKKNPLSFIELILCILSVIWVLIGRSGYFWPVWFFMMFGLFYMTPLGREDISAMVEGLAKGTVWSFLILEFGLMPFRPYDVVRYTGFVCNSNNFAILLEVVSVLNLVVILQAVLSKCKKVNITKETGLTKKLDKTVKVEIFRIVFYSMVLCFLSVLIFMTGCRTVWGIHFIIVALFFAGILIVKFRISVKKVLIALAGGIVFTAVILYPTYLVIRYVPTIHPHPIWFSGEYSEAKVHSYDPADSEKYVSFEEMMDSNLGRIGEMFRFMDKSGTLSIITSAEEIQPEESESQTLQDQAEEIQAGQDRTEEIQAEQIRLPYVVYNASLPVSINVRLNYYKIYFDKFNLLGNNSGKYSFILCNIYGQEGCDEVIYHSQNLWIQLIYQFGIPFGIMMFAVFIIQLVRAFGIMIKGKDFCSILPAFIYVVYAIYGLVEVTWLPGFLILTMFFLVQHPDFGEEKSA